MNRQYVIKAAGPDDIELLSRLIRESFRDVSVRFSLTRENCPRHPSNCTNDWIESDLSRGVQYFILWRDGKPTGCVGIECPGQETCYIERLAVLPEARRQGFGCSLVRHALERAASAGVRKVSIGIIAEQTELEQWYRKFGFVAVQTKSFQHLPFQIKLMEVQRDNPVIVF